MKIAAMREAKGFAVHWWYDPAAVQWGGTANGIIHGGCGLRLPRPRCAHLLMASFCAARSTAPQATTLTALTTCGVRPVAARIRVDRHGGCGSGAITGSGHP